MSDVPSAMAILSIVSNPNQKCGGGVFSLVAGRVLFSADVALLLFSADVTLLPPILFCPNGGEVESVITKSGSSVKTLAAPLPAIFLQGRTLVLLLVSRPNFSFFGLILLSDAYLLPTDACSGAL